MYDHKPQITFLYTSQETKITYSLEGYSSINDVLDAVRFFLLSVGYQINGELCIMEEQLSLDQQA